MKELSALITDLARSLGFLSRLPVAARFFEGHSGEMSRTPRAFPLAGVVIAAPAGLFLALLVGFDANTTLAAFAAVTVQILLSGALHEDGLADCADGLGGGASREKSLSIMKDSRVGSYGVLALLLSLGIKVSAIASLIQTVAPINVALCLIGVAALSRALMVWHWHSLPPARPDGVAASLGKPDDKALYTALAFGIGVAAVTIVPFAGFHPLVVCLIISAAAAYGFQLYVQRKLGGQTGDTIGATQQICEMMALAALSITL
ncbi:adenosylcobinamide-GDP ribazoletransferase [Agrobacterium vitis]|nr:adenosylcobinamide-GDP ribazoletransferase [Agrobacterium vitis]MBE1437689.1 adenosylcobinamide-GDP ribazoletransferase [Agrobacterium vitis]